MKKYKLGIFAEYFAAMLYMLRFYSMLHHRMKTYVGEIDLVASKFNQLVFIEVKARKCGIYDGIVSNSQQELIRRAAELFLSKNAKYQNYDVRFDLVVIRPYKAPLIIRNAW